MVSCTTEPVVSEEKKDFFRLIQNIKLLQHIVVVISSFYQMYISLSLAQKFN